MTDDKFSKSDPNSYSNSDEAVIKHLHLCANIDFEKKNICGYVDLTVEKKDAAVKQITLDTSDIKLTSVTNLADCCPLTYKFGAKNEVFGTILTVDLPKCDLTPKIRIKYETDPTASALQWLEPAQTSGGKHPYMFSQCQPIHCRSLIPCQDTPSVKMTYSAQITAPSALTVLMSALKEGATVKLENCISQHNFRQDVPIPSYLIAIAVGNLKSQKLGKRTNIWSEPEYVDAAAFEFSETETMLETAEEICGKYVWGIYDILLMPPSFPFGGMENPCLTFVTPTLLAGDKSLACVIAHEISHSWTGNLVTNCNFEHFWLNEGFTMFVERKIAGRLQGEPARQFAAINGLNDLRECLKVMGEDNALTKLVVNLKGVHPDDAFSVVPYEKGSTFLFYLEQLVGGPAKFEPFLKQYLDHYKFKSINTDDFKGYFLKYFEKNDAVKTVEWSCWLDTPGMPFKIPCYDKTLVDACTDFATNWIKWDGVSIPSFANDDLKKFSPLQIEEIIAQLLLTESFPAPKVELMEKLYKLNSVKNCDMKFKWLRLCLKARWLAAVPLALEFVTTYGRLKYVRPLYRDLYAWEDMREKAIATFRGNQHRMMHVTAAMVAKDLHITL